MHRREHTSTAHRLVLVLPHGSFWALHTGAAPWKSCPQGHGPISRSTCALGGTDSLV